MKTTDIIIIVIGAVLAFFAYNISKDIHDRRVEPVVLEPTATAGYQLTPNPTYTLSYETQVPDLTATSFFGWQTAQAEQAKPTSMTGRIGEGTPTPAIGSRDMSGDQHQRIP